MKTSDSGLRILFFGTPSFAVPSFMALVEAGHTVFCITQAPQKSGRGLRKAPSAVRIAAEHVHVPVREPLRLDDAFLEELRLWNADLAVVASYGKIFSSKLLALPRHGFINVHPSLLPRHRGASPVVGAIVDGDKETGVTIMQLDEGLDTGPILAQETVQLRGDETAPALTDVLAQHGARLLLATVLPYISEKITPQPQLASAATMTKRITKEDGHIDWQKSATRIAREIRAYQPWPGSWTLLSGKRFIITSARVVRATKFTVPGTVTLFEDASLAVFCGEGTLLHLQSVLAEGGQELSGDDLFHGYRRLVGRRFGE